MRILRDTSIGPRVAAHLTAEGHDVLRVGGRAPDPGDEAVLAWALREGRILVTADKDFGDLAFERGLAHAGIVRVVDHPLARLPATIRAAVERYAAELAAGALVTVEPTRVRVREGRARGPYTAGGGQAGPTG